MVCACSTEAANRSTGQRRRGPGCVEQRAVALDVGAEVTAWPSAAGSRRSLQLLRALCWKAEFEPGSSSWSTWERMPMLLQMGIRILAAERP